MSANHPASKPLRRALLLGAAACLTWAAGASLPAAAADEPGVSSSPEPLASPALRRAAPGDIPFSTEAERKAARPMPWAMPPAGPAAPGGQQRLTPDAERPGAPGSSSSGSPDPNAERIARQQFPEAWRGSQQQQLRGTPEPGGDRVARAAFTQFFWDRDVPSRQRVFPGVAVGKLFFRTPSGSSSCTASVVSGNNVVVTAAHCCHGGPGGGWYGDWSFAPALRGSDVPFGVFPGLRAWIPGLWPGVGARDRGLDVCVIRLGNNRFGRPATFYTGWLGRTWNQSTTAQHHAFGYPGNFGGGVFKGVCVDTTRSAPAGACNGSGTLTMGCGMTFGASGGPWIRNFQVGGAGGNQVNSVVSGFDGAACNTPAGTRFNGPRFTSNNIVPLCNAAGC
jgi:V8-like Glu-specific endopeptidase